LLGIGESPCQQLFARHLRGKNTFCLSFFSFDFFNRVFLAVSLHDELKNTIQIFSKIRPKNLKKSQKK
jgi:hypothetical protein